MQTAETNMLMLCSAIMPCYTTPQWPSSCPVWGQRWRPPPFDGFVYPPVLVLGPVGRCHGVRQQNYSLKQVPDEVTPREPTVESSFAGGELATRAERKIPECLWLHASSTRRGGHQCSRTNPRRASQAEPHARQRKVSIPTLCHAHLQPILWKLYFWKHHTMCPQPSLSYLNPSTHRHIF